VHFCGTSLPGVYRVALCGLPAAARPVCRFAFRALFRDARCGHGTLFACGGLLALFCRWASRVLLHPLCETTAISLPAPAWLYRLARTVPFCGVARGKDWRACRAWRWRQRSTDRLNGNAAWLLPWLYPAWRDAVPCAPLPRFTFAILHPAPGGPLPPAVLSACSLAGAWTEKRERGLDVTMRRHYTPCALPASACTLLRCWRPFNFLGVNGIGGREAPGFTCSACAFPSHGSALPHILLLHARCGSRRNAWGALTPLGDAAAQAATC